MPRFRSVILDVDSTLCAVEGIDWLARQRGAAIAKRITAITERAMNGEIPLESVYGARLGAVEPDAALLGRLAREYVEAIVPGADEAVRRLQAARIELAIVSGGIRQALMPLAEHLGIPDHRLVAVDVFLDEEGNYSAFDAMSPLVTDTGKAEVASMLDLPRPVLAVGDGNTDLASRPAVDAFAAFTGVIRRDPVVAAADHVIESFEQLTALVLS